MEKTSWTYIICLVQFSLYTHYIRWTNKLTRPLEHTVVKYIKGIQSHNEFSIFMQNVDIFDHILSNLSSRTPGQRLFTPVNTCISLKYHVRTHTKSLYLVLYLPWYKWNSTLYYPSWMLLSPNRSIAVTLVSVLVLILDGNSEVGARVRNV